MFVRGITTLSAIMICNYAAVLCCPRSLQLLLANGAGVWITLFGSSLEGANGTPNGLMTEGIALARFSTCDPNMLDCQVALF